jgi:hypothetical protein
MTELFNLAACKALHMSQPSPPKISIGIEISQPPMNGGLSSIQESMNIGGEPHQLSYINSDEASLLKQLGGSGQPVNGIPAYWAGEGWDGWGGPEQASADASAEAAAMDAMAGRGPPDVTEAEAKAANAAAEAANAAATTGAFSWTVDEDPGYLSPNEMAGLYDLPEGFAPKELYNRGLLTERQREAMVRAHMRSSVRGREALKDPNMNWEEQIPYLGPEKGKRTLGGDLVTVLQKRGL